MWAFLHSRLSCYFYWQHVQSLTEENLNMSLKTKQTKIEDTVLTSWTVKGDISNTKHIFIRSLSMHCKLSSFFASPFHCKSTSITEKNHMTSFPSDFFSFKWRKQEGANLTGPPVNNQGRHLWVPMEVISLLSLLEHPKPGESRVSLPQGLLLSSLKTIQLSQHGW